MEKFKSIKKYYQYVFSHALRKTVDICNRVVPVKPLNILILILACFTLYIITNSLALKDYITPICYILIPILSFIVILICQLICSPVDLHFEQISERNAIETEKNALIEKKLSIEFHPQSPTFEQVEPMLDKDNNLLGTLRLYRIIVKCVGSAVTLTDVSVFLEKVDPIINSFLPVTLHHMHDNPINVSQQYKTHFNLNQGETKFIDVVKIIERTTTGNRGFIFVYSVSGTQSLIEEKPLRLTIKATSKDCQAVEKDFIIREHEIRGYIFEESTSDS